MGVPGPGLGRFAACLVALSSSSGWVGFPLPRFPCGFPLVLGCGGGAFCVSSLLLSSILHLLCRVRLGKPGDPARNPPGPHRSCTWLVPPRPSPAGSRRGYASSARVVG